MERIDVQQLTPKPIPAISEVQARAETDPVGSVQAHSWLSSAMAIWLRDDDAKPSGAPEQAAQAKTHR